MLAAAPLPAALFVAMLLASPAQASSAGGASPDAAAVPAGVSAPDRTDLEGPLPPLQGHEAEPIEEIPVPDEELVGRYVKGLLATRREWIQKVLNRSESYRGAIRAALARRGMPQELGWLPAVESGFQARAVSPAGAAGLWQLMRNTASPYGLRMDLWVDERRSVEKATDASLAKLSENREQFGDWYLALAAYNCGAGRLSAILRRYPDSDFWDLRRRRALPRETAAFVPQFLALARILGHAGRYGFDLAWEPPPDWILIPLDRCVDLRMLASASGAPLDELLAGNPELNFMVTPPPSYGYELKVPASCSDAVNEALDGTAVPLLEFRVHVVTPGDTLSGMSRRYGVSVPLIQEFNPGVRARALRIGARVLIPLLPPRSQAR